MVVNGNYTMCNIFKMAPSRGKRGGLGGKYLVYVGYVDD